MPNRDNEDRARGTDFDLHRGYGSPGSGHGTPGEDPFGRGFEPHETGIPVEHIHEPRYTQPYDRWRPRDYVFYAGEGYHREFVEPYKPPGRYAGRGPRNYVRSDSRIFEDVNERLTMHPDIDATNIEVEVADGEVTLRGWVPDRNSRYLAEDAAWTTRGVKNVNDLLVMDQRVRQIPILPGRPERRGRQRKPEMAKDRSRNEAGDVGARGSADHSGSGVLGSTQFSEQTREGSSRTEDADAKRKRTP